MNYAILRTAKLKTMGNIGGSLAHNYRTIETPNADPNLTSKNHHTVATPEAVKQAIKDRLPEKRRSDAVLCIEYLITASPEWEGWGSSKEVEFFKRSAQWL
ncbi:plasmid recombination protein, partial [Psychrobacter sp. NPDC078370]